MANMEKNLQFIKTLTIENFKKSVGVESLSTWRDNVNNRIYMSGDTHEGNRIFVAMSKEIQNIVARGKTPDFNLRISEVADKTTGSISYLLHKEGASEYAFSL